MKVAVISDIHGNIQALNAVLADIEKEKCEKIFCLGDLAMAGPEPEEAILRIIELEKKGKLLCIQGNTDLLIANYNDEIIKKLAHLYPIMSVALQDDVKIISSAAKKYLSELNSNLELEIEGVKILLVHGSPRKNDENIMPDLKIECIEEMLIGVDSNIVFCGHTHIPCGYQTTKKQTVVNVGSVGRPFTSNVQSCYVIAEFLSGDYNVMHKFVDYDNKKAANILSKRGFTGADKLAEILLKPEKRHL